MSSRISKCLFGLVVCPLTALSEITETKIVANDGSEADYFGISVRISGDRAIVGASTAYVTGSSVYVFRREDTDWVQEAKLTRNGSLGPGASIYGDYAIVSGVDSAYVYRNDGVNWIEEATLLPPDDIGLYSFGGSVSIWENLACVGAQNESVYVFRRDEAGWVLEGRLGASDGQEPEAFTPRTSISDGKTIFGVAGDDDQGEDSGAAYIFKRVGVEWVEEIKLMASDGTASDNFGSSVSISGDYAIIGANGDDDNGIRSGAAYVFRRDGLNWVEEAKLIPSDGAAYEWFGSAVSISGDYAIVGAYAFHPGKWDGFGSAYIYKREGDEWVELTRLSASDGDENNFFGYSVSLFGEHAIVGAYFDINEGGWEAGAAYIYSGFTTTACDDYTNLLIRCGEASTVKARVVLQNSIAHSGETVLFEIDSTIYPATIVDNGISSRASISIPGLGAGPHTVSVLDPAGCFTPRVVTCGAGNDDQAWDEDEARWGVESLQRKTNSAPATRILGNFPNPFNPSTAISYQLSADSRVVLRVYDTLGEEVATLVDQYQAAGVRSAVWNGRNSAGSQVASGIYMYKLTAGNHVQTGRMLLMK